MKEKSIHYYKKCYKDHYGASIYLANIMVEYGAGEKAPKYFENCIKLNPQLAAPHFGLMLALKRHANNDIVLKHFRQIIKEDPDNFEALA
jgi:tetratricopeptide (TPR) repeat protein